MPRYIDADALKDVIQQHDCPLADKLNSIGNGMFTLGIFQAIDQMPTVSPDEVRGKGKWLDHPIDDDWKICSVCGVGSRFRYTLFDGETKIPFSVTESSRYCKNCGAKMEVTSDALP